MIAHKGLRNHKDTITHKGLRDCTEEGPRSGGVLIYSAGGGAPMRRSLRQRCIIPC